MEQQDEMSQEVMDADPLMLESIDDFDAFLELGESIESILSHISEDENVNAEEGEVTGTSNAVMMSHIMDGC